MRQRPFAIAGELHGVPLRVLRRSETLCSGHPVGCRFSAILGGVVAGSLLIFRFGSGCHPGLINCPYNGLPAFMHVDVLHGYFLLAGFAL